MKMKLFKISSLPICAAILALPVAGFGQTSYTVANSVGSFLAASSSLADMNFGSAGTFALAGASAPNGQLDTVLMFDTTAAASQFNSYYGAGNWTITGLTLGLASNFGVQGDPPPNDIFSAINGGSFGIDWLANNSWVAGSGGGMGGTGYPNNTSVSYDDIPNLFANGSDSLGTFTYTPPGNNVYVNYSLPLDGNLVNGAAAGGDVSLFFYAADNQLSF
jgi:hypothetical protein